MRKCLQLHASGSYRILPSWSFASRGPFTVGFGLSCRVVGLQVVVQGLLPPVPVPWAMVSCHHVALQGL